jgi:squalene synthase HpnC
MAFMFLWAPKQSKVAGRKHSASLVHCNICIQLINQIEPKAHYFSIASMPVDHYENFPVASWLSPPRLRPAIQAIYWFARTADDIADEGEAPASERLADLGAFQADLLAIAAGQPHGGRWPGVFDPLQAAIRAYALPVPLLDDLLSAFAQDVRHTDQGHRYADRAELLDYCRRSANPIGRLLLHLYDVNDELALAQSDRICSALQLINFWQDLSVDLPRQRWYLPLDACQREGLTPEAILSLQTTPATARLIAGCVQWAREMMLAGAPLVHRLPGRTGLELRLVVQGGLRILDKIEAMDHASLSRRPRLGKADALPLVWRALRM